MKRIIVAILPPVIVQLIKKVLRLAGLRKSTHVAKFSNSIFVESPKFALYQRGNRPFYVNAEDLRYGGGVAFSENQHHFIRYYNHGYSALKDFYQSHQPDNIFDQHFLDCRFPISAEQNILPWTMLEDNRPFRGENGLDHTHGRQHYGPVSERKVGLEASRLDSILLSIKQHGYKEEYGFPRGYLLEHDQKDDLKFLVVGGQHRAAAMVALQFDPVPVMFQPNYPRIIRRSDVADWPQVASGLFEADSALLVFDAYFRHPNDKLILTN